LTPDDLQDIDELRAFCEDAWSDDVDPELLASLAQSTYGLGDCGWGEEADDLASDLFNWEKTDIYQVLGEGRG